MKRQNRTAGRGGFTLMEMLIVVAIIAILVAIAVPVFTNSLKKARDTACAANRRSLQAVLSITLITEDEAAARAQFDAEVGKYTCPSKGVYSMSFNENGQIRITCSKHGWTEENTQTLAELLTGMTWRESIDSTAPATNESGDSNRKKLEDALADKKLSLTGLSATSWQAYNISGNKFFFWTTVDISKLDLEQTKSVPVIRYNLQTGTYTVWSCPVVNSRAATGNTTYRPSATVDYTVLNAKSPTGYSPSTGNTDPASQTLAKAQQHYLTYLKTFKLTYK